MTRLQSLQPPADATSPPLSPAAPRPVLRRLLPPLAGLLVWLVIGAGTLLWRQHRHNVRDLLERMNSQVFSEFQVDLRNQAAAMEQILLGISSDSNLKWAMFSDDDEQLLRDWLSVYEEMRQKHGLSHFNFISTDHRVYLRLQNPSLRGDIADRFTVREAHRTGRASSGIEIGMTGTLVLRVVQPIYWDGDLLGFVEMGKEIDGLLWQRHLASGSHLAIALQKDGLDPARWDAEMRKNGRDLEWNRLPNAVIAYATQGRLPNVVAQLLDLHVADGCRPQAVDIRSNGQRFRLASAPLRDASGREIGCLAVLADVTEESAAFARLLWRGGLVGGAMLAALLGFVFALLRRTDAGIRAQHERLRISEERLAQGAAQSRTFVWEVDRNGLYAFASPAVESMLGYAPSELVGRLHFFDLCLPEDRDAIRQHGLDVIRRADSEQQFENRMVGKDGRVVWVLTSGKSLLGPDGAALGFRGSNTDVTPIKRAEELLKNSELRVSGILERLPSGLLALDAATGRFVFANETLCRMLGYPKDELLAIPPDDLHAPDDLPRAIAAFEKAMRGESAYADNLLLRRKDGSTLTADIHNAFMEIDGRPCLLCLYTDVSGRKRAEDALGESQAQLQAILDGVADVVWSLGYPDLKPRLISSSVERLYGHPREAFYRNPKLWEEVVHPDDRFESEQAMEHLLEQGYARRECRILRPDGEIRWISVRRKVAYDDHGCPIRIDGVASDITERKLAEKELFSLASAVEQAPAHLQ